MKENLTGALTRTALSTAFLVLCSWLSVPLAIPFTMQTYAVCVVSALIGRRNAVMSVLLYILLCCAGVPVLAGYRGGVGAIMGCTGGYVLGFLLTAFAVGSGVRRYGTKPFPLAAAMALGVVLCYMFGTAWFVWVYTGDGKAMSTAAVLSACVLPYILPDAVKIWLAVLTARRVEKHIRIGGKL